MSVQLGLAMPQPGETITEGVVMQWLKKEGDMIKEKDPVVELETAKAVYDFESPLEGKLIKILVQPNETQQVGKSLAIIECDDEKAKKYLMFGVAVPLDNAPAAAAAPSTATAVTPAATTAATGTGAGALQYSPLIRTLAQEHGIPVGDLAKIPATGAGGKLTKEDILNYAGNKGGAAAPTPAVTVNTGVSGKRTEATAIRKRIADNLHLSKTTIPHAGSAVDVDMTTLMNFRNAKKDEFQKKNGVPLSFGPFFMTAVMEAIKQYPQANSFYIVEGAKHFIEAHDMINIGFAVGAQKGLMVPVLKNAQSKSFVELAKGVNELVTKAKDGKLSPDDLTGGTITVNNPGALGSTRGNQIIVYPQAIIVGFQKMVERPAVVNGKVEVRTIMECDCSFDHRILDGVEAVGFLEAIRNVLENPEKYFNTI
ncbi:MAG: hypothetical protein COV45_08200 [Deltaproteobacteria bacterium CG11_big_fil_rev_8_21_14_0_20_47_16]|nr:MAG: hypothetical protein COV45_08200 [Deltaproteobacteria bacterium CG11_big_fil_rev_8_21_14_0_20_47_16]